MTKKYAVDESTQSHALIDENTYNEMYQSSVNDNEAFWAAQANRIDWFKPFTEIKDVSYARDDVHIKWFTDGVLNACYNCVDRHLPEKKDDVAIIWEGDDPNNDMKITYGEQTGQLDEMFGSVASYYEEEFDVAVGNLSSLIEPIMIVFMGITIGGLMLAMYAPIFNVGAIIN